MKVKKSSRNHSTKVKIGVSRCLLGENVRYDGKNKLDKKIKYELGKFFSWVRICPEKECGLGVPREKMRLELRNKKLFLIGIESGNDYTPDMYKWIEKVIPKLKKHKVVGFILKSKSPSCGVREAKVYKKEKLYSSSESGIFVRELKRYFPLLPLITEKEIHNQRECKKFLKKVLRSEI